MVSNISQISQIDPKQAISVFRKLTSAIKYQNQQILKEIDQTKMQIGYFENNIKLIKSSKYYRLINYLNSLLRLK